MFLSVPCSGTINSPEGGGELRVSALSTALMGREGEGEMRDLW